eukprot:TRINITY_DN1250_c0_g1_i3.p1 TRINITY_DN1250_c0_g1~~TRINITY_DN1250_c0_g1_i3.p1  ORF type:complete len:472 (-),score=131.45 TRINITY_DN1250_c0_g1_i3:821-2236(-)
MSSSSSEDSPKDDVLASTDLQPEAETATPEVEATTKKDELEVEDSEEEKAMALTKERVKVGVTMFVVTVINISLIVGYLMAIGSCYLTPFWNPPDRFDTMDAALIVWDRGMNISGQHVNVGETLAEQIYASGVFKFHMLDPSYELDHCKDKVADNTYWFVLAFPSNYTQVLLGSWWGKYFPYPNGTYVNPVLDVFDEGKQYTTTLLVRRGVQAIFDSANFQLATYLRSGILGPSSARTSVGVTVQPLQRQSVNLHPITKYGWYFASYMTFMILWISTLLGTLLFIPTFHMKLTKRVHMPFRYMVLCRMATFMVAEMLLGLFDAVIVRWYDMPMHKNFGTLFVMYWLAGLCFSAFMQPLFAAFGEGASFIATWFLILQLATCDGIYAKDTLPPFFRGVGQLLPFYHCVPLFRNITVDANPNEVGLHVGVLILWTVAGYSLALPLWYYEVAEKNMRLVLPVFLDAFHHMSKVI